LAKLASFETRFAAMEKEVADLAVIVRTIEAIRLDVAGLRTVVDGVKAVVDGLGPVVDSLKGSQESFQRLEIESKKRSVLIRGLKFRTDSKYKTRPQTREALTEFFEKVDMLPHLIDYQRLGGLRDGEDGSKVSIRIEFSDVDQRIVLFDKLKLKGKDLPEFSVLTDYPKFQLQEFKALSEAAYNIRTENPGTRTRVVPKGLGLSLQRRAAVTDKWMSVRQE
jgi:hypothetical protein